MFMSLIFLGVVVVVFFLFVSLETLPYKKMNGDTKKSLF